MVSGFAVRLKVLVSFALVAMLLLGKAAFADDLNYDDPGMHFRAPDGFTRVRLGEDAANEDGAPVALFVLHSGAQNARSITITIDDKFDGTLAEFVTSKQSSIRQGAGDNGAVLFERKEPATSKNGMPMELLVWTLSEDQTAPLKYYSYLFIDGQRSVQVSYIGHAIDVTDAEALAALSTIYAVAYPKHSSDSQ